MYFIFLIFLNVYVFYKNNERLNLHKKSYFHFHTQKKEKRKKKKEKRKKKKRKKKKRKEKRVIISSNRWRGWCIYCKLRYITNKVLFKKLKEETNASHGSNDIQSATLILLQINDLLND
jgi:hypothetical protein